MEIETFFKLIYFKVVFLNIFVALLTSLKSRKDKSSIFKWFNPANILLISVIDDRILKPDILNDVNELHPVNK